MSDLYYTPPSNGCFEEMKAVAIKLWREVAENESYLNEKVGQIENLDNAQDNFMFMVAMFSPNNQRKLARALSDKTKKEVSDRLIAGGSPPEFDYFKEIKMSDKIHEVTLDGTMYNIMHGTNKYADIILLILGLIPKNLGRFRDAWFNAEGTEITIFTRNGGGNREDYFPDKITKHSLYLRNYDDEYDSTYAHIIFKVPEEVWDVTKILAAGKTEKTLKEKTEESFEKMKSMKSINDIPWQIKKARDKINNALNSATNNGPISITDKG